MGFGALASESVKVTDQMFLRAAQTLAAQTSAEDLALGRCYPALSHIREVQCLFSSLHIASLHFRLLRNRTQLYEYFQNNRSQVSAAIAAAVADEAHKTGLARRERPADLLADIKSRMFVPEYHHYI